MSCTKRTLIASVMPLVLAALVSATFIQASLGQIPLDHAVVLSRHPAPPAARLIAVDLKTGATTALGRFGFDTAAPLAIAHDPVNRDLLVAVTWLTGSRILRLQLTGLAITGQQVLADVPGQVEELVLARGGDVVFITGGTGGTLYSLPRNGGQPRSIALLPRASALFSDSGNAAEVVFVVQSGQAGNPAIEPIHSIIDLRTGAQAVRIDMRGYRPLGITGFGFLPNAFLTAIITGEDGSVGESIRFGKPTKVTVTPRLPAGATIALRLQDYFKPIVLGGRADPRLKRVEIFGQNRQWQFVSGNLPGTPVDFDVTFSWLRHTVYFGQRCQRSGMFIGASSGGPPKLGNAKFLIATIGAVRNSSALLALGLSDRRFAGLGLPLTLPGGCELLVSVDAVLGVPTNSIGLGLIGIPVPNDAQLIGTTVFAQFGQANGGNLNTTDAVALHVHR